VALGYLLLLELDHLGTNRHVVCPQVALCVAEIEDVVVRVVLEGCDGGCGESEAPVVLGLLEEDHLDVAVVEPTHEYELVVDGNEGDGGGQLLVVEADLNGLELELDLLLLGKETALLPQDLKEIVVVFAQNEEELVSHELDT